MKKQIDHAEHSLADGTAIIKTDPDNHSDRFQFITIRNSQKIFFEQIENCVYLITAGHDRRNWKALLKDLEDYADRQTAHLKKRDEPTEPSITPQADGSGVSGDHQ